MKTLVCLEPGALALEERAMPASPPAGWVSIDIRYVGVCGTDYHIFEGNQPYLDYPRVMGHELGAVVAADAEGFRAGDLVAVNPYISCGTCRACLRGKPNCCSNIAVLGVHRDGGMCERINVPATNLYPARGLTPQQAAMTEFLAIGAHGVRRAAPSALDRVLVVGTGPIGVAAALFARLDGAEVHLLEASAARLSMVAERFGFETCHRLEDGIDALLAPTGGAGYDVVIDATGNGKAIEAGFAYAGHGATYVLLSIVKDTISFADPEFHKRELSLLGSRNATRVDFERAMTAMRTGAIDSTALHTHSSSLDALPEHMPGWARNREDIIKAVVEV